jgi:hypothetical protein
VEQALTLGIHLLDMCDCDKNDTQHHDIIKGGTPNR